MSLHLHNDWADGFVKFTEKYPVGTVVDFDWNGKILQGNVEFHQKSSSFNKAMKKLGFPGKAANKHRLVVTIRAIGTPERKGYFVTEDNIIKV